MYQVLRSKNKSKFTPSGRALGYSSLTKAKRHRNALLAHDPNLRVKIVPMP